ncbi:hypothetical protein N9D70_02965 [bacterium]|nr:hypothetical protein [bacterium]
MSKQTTISGLRAEIEAFANRMFVLQSRSPIIATFGVDDVRSMDVKGHPRLEQMKEQVVIELLSAGDAAGPSYYTAQPLGKPFRRRVAAATPILDTFMRVASQLSRKNAHRALRGRRTIFK